MLLFPRLNDAVSLIATGQHVKPSTEKGFGGKIAKTGEDKEDIGVKRGNNLPRGVASHSKWVRVG